MLYLEISSGELRAARDAGNVVRSPACALLVGNQVLIGDSALAQSRLNPRRVFDRFWADVCQDPMPRATRTCRHYADLAYLHLEATILSLGQPAASPEPVIIAVPANYTREQLALVLGIAEAAQLEPVALVDAPLLESMQTVAMGADALLDIGLHASELTLLQRNAAGVSVTETITVDGAGSKALLEEVAKYCQRKFIEQSRFDPFHRAESEQWLFDQLPAWLAAVRPNASVDLVHEQGGSAHRARVDWAELVEVIAPVAGRIRARLPAARNIAGTHRLLGFPGFSELATVGLADADALFRECRRRLEQLDTRGPDGVGRLREMDHVGADEDEDVTQRAVAPPSHVLAGHQAFAVSSSGVWLLPTGGISATPVEVGVRIWADAAGVMAEAVGDVVLRLDSVGVLAAPMLVGAGEQLELEGPGQPAVRFGLITVNGYAA